MTDQFQVSNKIPCDDGLLALSPDGQYFAAKSGKWVLVSSCSSLQKLMSFPTTETVTILKFSSDSNYLSWLSAEQCLLNIGHVNHKELLEIPIEPGLSIISIIFGQNCLLYISELEVFIGVYDFAKHKSFTLEGCSLDDFDSPLLTFSPNGDYLAYIKGYKLVVHSTETWELKASFNCPISPQRPLFVHPYTILLYNHDGVIEWFSIFGLKLKSDIVLPNKCMMAVTLSKNSRTLFGSTYDNKVVSFDTISMDREMELECSHFFKSGGGVKTFVATNEEVQKSKNLKLQKFKEIHQSTLRDLNNLLDQFKRKTQARHFIVMNYDDSLLATYNPDNNSVWIWDFSKETRLESVISLNETSGKMKALRWHRFSNRLAVCCTNLVVIWTQWDALLGFPGDNMNFKWLNFEAAVGVIIAQKDCRFVYFK